MGYRPRGRKVSDNEHFHSLKALRKDFKLIHTEVSVTEDSSKQGLP